MAVTLPVGPNSEPVSPAVPAQNGVPDGVPARDAVGTGVPVPLYVACAVWLHEGDVVRLPVGVGVRVVTGVPVPVAVHSGVWLAHAPTDSDDDGVTDVDGELLPLLDADGDTDGDDVGVDDGGA